MKTFAWVPIALSIAFGTAGCGDDDGALDAAVDASSDVREDATADSGADTAVDALADVAVDTEPDADEGPVETRPLDLTLDTLHEDPVLPDCASDLMRAAYEASRVDEDTDSLPDSMLISQNNEAVRDVLHRGIEVFPRIADLIAGAHSEVAYQTYIWKPSDPADEIEDGVRRLHARLETEGPRERPVRVRFLFDTSSVGAGPDLSEVSRDIATRMEGLDLDPELILYEISGFDRVALGNLHSKSVVIDGEVGIIMGTNVQEENDFNDGAWNDYGFEVRGDAALGLLADFDHAWRRSRQWTCGTEDGSREDCSFINGDPTVYNVVDHDVEACLPIMIAMRVGDANPFANRTDNTQDQTFIALMQNAEEVIRILTPNFNDDVARDEVVAAVQRGVRVELITGLGFNASTAGLPGQGGTNRDNVEMLYTRLIDGGMSAAEACAGLQVRWYSHDGSGPVDGNVPTASHAKYMSVDDQVVVTGSANQDTQAWNFSREVNIVVDDEATTRAWDAQAFTPAFERGAITEHCEDL